MHGKVLEAGGCREYRLVAVAMLKSLDAGKPHGGCEVGVFAVGFHASSPARVAENVDVGREESQPRVVVVFFCGLCLVVFAVCFGGCLCENVLHEFRIERCCQCYRHRPHGCRAVAPDAVQSFIPPAVGFQSEAWYGGVAVLHERKFLVEGKPLDKIVDACVNVERSVAVRVFLCVALRGKQRQSRYGGNYEYQSFHAAKIRFFTIR